MTNKFKRKSPHICKQCGLCCQGRGDLWGDEDSWPNGYEPKDCTAFDKETHKCTVYADRRDYCREYPWDELCERELKELEVEK